MFTFINQRTISPSSVDKREEKLLHTWCLCYESFCCNDDVPRKLLTSRRSVIWRISNLYQSTLSSNTIVQSITLKAAQLTQPRWLLAKGFVTTDTIEWGVLQAIIATRLVWEANWPDLQQRLRERQPRKLTLLSRLKYAFSVRTPHSMLIFT